MPDPPQQGEAMKRLFAIIGTVPLVLLAACGDDDDRSSATVPSARTEAASAGASAATVKVVAVTGMGNVLGTPDGMVLYFNDQDTADGSVLCDKSCADEWPPHTRRSEPAWSHSRRRASGREGDRRACAGRHRRGRRGGPSTSPPSRRPRTWSLSPRRGYDRSRRYWRRGDRMAGVRRPRAARRRPGGRARVHLRGG